MGGLDLSYHNADRIHLSPKIKIKIWTSTVTFVERMVSAHVHDTIVQAELVSVDIAQRVNEELTAR